MIERPSAPLRGRPAATTAREERRGLRAVLGGGAATLAAGVAVTTIGLTTTTSTRAAAHVNTAGSTITPAAASTGARPSSAPPASRFAATAALPGRLSTHMISGPASHYRGTMDVWTPPGYSATSRRTYPVLMALHGWPGNPKFMESHTNVLQQVASAAAGHHMAWPIVIAPRWGMGVDTECTNGTPSEQLETWLTKDLPAWLEANYHVRTGPQNWATFGYSAGAWCSRMLTMRHPNLFGADIDMSGYSTPWFEAPYVPFGPTSAQARSYDLVRLAHTNPPHVAIYLVSTPGDKDSYPSTVSFLRAARRPMRITWVPAPGGHSMALWGPQMPRGFAWLGRTLTGFRA